MAVLIFLGWLAWAPLTPAIVAVTRRFPLQRGMSWRAVVAHALAAIVCIVLVAVLWNHATAAALEALRASAPPGTPPSAQRGGTPWRLFLNPVGHAHLVGTVTYACIVAAVTAFDARDRVHRAVIDAARLERDVAQAREHAIKMQVHPHFLFNTLHAVAVLITEDPATARGMVVHLGDFLRATLARASRIEVALHEELDLLGHYLEVERLRFGDRLRVEIDVDVNGDGDALDALVPDLVLQPLVENAIKHGVSSRPGAHRVVVRARRVGQALVLSVDDDGAGPPSEEREGIGLRATRQRLAHLYGSEWGVALVARPEGGTRATVTLPYHRQPVGGSAAGAGGAS